MLQPDHFVRPDAHKETPPKEPKPTADHVTERAGPDGAWTKVAAEQMEADGTTVRFSRERGFDDSGKVTWDVATKKAFTEVAGKQRMVAEHGRDHEGGNKGKEWDKTVGYYDSNDALASASISPAEKKLGTYLDSVPGAIVRSESGNIGAAAESGKGELAGHKWRATDVLAADGKQRLAEVRVFVDDEGNVHGLYGNANEQPAQVDLPKIIDETGQAHDFSAFRVSRIERQFDHGSKQQIEVYYGVEAPGQPEKLLFNRTRSLDGKQVLKLEIPSDTN